MEDTSAAYIQCASGVSGDMLVGALVDAAVPLEYLRENLYRLFKGEKGGAESFFEEFEITARTVYKNEFKAVKFDVNIHPRRHHVHRRWQDIKDIVEAAGFDDDVKTRGLKIFHAIFEAEALAHGQPFDQTHLHELGGADCLADVFGFIFGIKYLGIERIIVSPVNIGGGCVNTSHGILPVPAPATANLLKAIPVYCSGVDFELTTPTGAAIVREMAEGFGAFPEMTVKTIGVGAGDRDIAASANVLRIFIGKMTDSIVAAADIAVIETNIDDMSPQLYGVVMERLFGAGALDVYITPVIMKKCRPAALLTVIAEEVTRDALSKIIFEETTSIGLRYYRVSRETLQRDISPVDTKYGSIRIKTARRNGKRLNVSAEYEDCKKAALEFSVPVKDVIREALGKADDS